MKGKVYRDREAKTESFYYVIELGRDLQGQRKQHKRRGFASEDAATAAMQKELVERREGIYVEPSDEPLAIYLERWLTATAPRRREGTTHRYRLAARQVLPTLGNVPIGRLTTLAIQQTYTDLLATNKPSTLRLSHAVIRSALGQAVRWDMLRRNPADGVDIPMPDRSPLVYWSPAEAQAFLAATGGFRDHTLWRFMLDTGVRVGEAEALRWADVDQARRTVQIRRTVTIGADRRPRIGSDTKTPASRRVISITEATAAALARHRIHQVERRLESGAAWHDLDLVFDRGDGGLYLHGSIANRLNQAIAAAGLPRLTPHGFRRTMTVTWLLAGESPRVISDRLGHRSSAFTLDVYAAVSEGWQSAAADRVAQFLETITGAG